ncbi:MAG TPA: hypothetical protein VN457_04720 [Chlamydiales bacterium]|nr:hypothetical protein [Chlamydiales bacterium]
MIEWIRRRWLLLLILPFVGWAVFKAIHLYDRRADGFTFEKIHSQLPYNPDWEVELLLKQLLR